MATLTYTLPATLFATDISGSGEFDPIIGIDTQSIQLTFLEGVSSFSYDIVVNGPDDLTFNLDPNPVSLFVGTSDLMDLDAGGFFTAVQFLELNWSAGTTALLSVFVEPDAGNTDPTAFDYLVELSGPPLPDFANPTAANLFLAANFDNASEISPSDPFGPGQDIVLADLQDVVITRNETDVSTTPTEGPDELVGDVTPNDIDGLGGNDTIDGGAQNDTLNGGAGDDVLFGNIGDDSLIDGTGNDVVRGGEGNDTISNTGGSDLFDGGEGRDLLITDVTGVADNGSVLLADLAGGRHGAKDSDVGQDQLIGIEDFTAIGDWSVEAIGDAEANVLRTDIGDDTVRGNGGDDTIETGEGDDILRGDAGADLLVGGEGNDIYLVDSDDTVVELAGDAGLDEVRTTEAASIGEGIEQLTAVGGAGIRLDGSSGADILKGNSGSNTLVGFGGEDTMIGGGGADNFVLTGRGGTDPDVTINDWGTGADRLAIDDQLLGIGAGGIDVRELTADVFQSLRDAESVSYSSRTGELTLDIDGDGSLERVATIEGGAQLGLDDVLLF